MQISNDIIYEILKYFKGKKLEQLKLINSTFNQIISDYFSLFPLIQTYYHNFTIKEKVNSKQLEIVSDNFDHYDLPINDLKNKRFRIEQVNIFLCDVFDEERLFNFFNEIKHVWENNSVSFWLFSSISLESITKIFTNLAKKCKTLEIFFWEKSIHCLNIRKEIIYNFLEENYGVNFSFDKIAGHIYNEDLINYDRFIYEIFTELKKVLNIFRRQNFLQRNKLNVFILFFEKNLKKLTFVISKLIM